MCTNSLKSLVHAGTENETITEEDTLYYHLSMKL